MLFSWGCQKTPKEKVTLLLDWLPNPNHIPLFVGVELGFFVEEGVNLEILKLLDPPSALPYLQSGKVDVILYYMPYALMAMSQEKNLRALGVLINEPLDGMICLSTDKKEELSHFKNKVLGVYPGARISKYLEAVFRDKGIAFADTKKIGIDPALAIMTGLVDVIAGVYWNIEPFQLEEFGQKTNFVKFSDMGIPSYHELIFVVRADILTKKPVLKSRFQKGLQKSIDFCKNNPEEAFMLYLKQCAGKSTSAKSWERKAWDVTVNLLPSSQTLDPNLFSSFIRWLEERGLIQEKTVNAEVFLSDR